MEFSVDKQIVSFKERLSFLKYMSKKSTQCAMKSFVLATGTVVIYITGSYIQVRISHITCIYYCKLLRDESLKHVKSFQRIQYHNKNNIQYTYMTKVSIDGHL